MKYEIGQKVITPLGLVGEIKQYSDEMSKVAIKSVDGIYTYFYNFMNKKLKPYKTPHEKLIEMGFEIYNGRLSIRIISDNGYFIIINKKEKQIDSLGNTLTFDLWKVFAEYLEWLEEEK